MLLPFWGMCVGVCFFDFLCFLFIGLVFFSVQSNSGGGAFSFVRRMVERGGAASGPPDRAASLLVTRRSVRDGTQKHLETNLERIFLVHM